MRRTSALAVVALTATLALSACAGSDTTADSDQTTPSPSATPTDVPSEEPTVELSDEPTEEPSDKTPTETPATSPSALPDDGSVFVVPAATSTRCRMPTPEVLSGYSHAFMGTVKTVDEGAVLLTVDHWFVGGGPRAVRIDTTPVTGKAVHATEAGFLPLRQGQQYLMSGSDGYLALCGLSGKWSAKLEQLYMNAFPQ